MFVEVWFFCCYCLCLRWILTILNTNKTHLVCTNRDQSTDRSVAWCVCVCAVSSVDGIISSQLIAQSQSQPSKCAIHSSTLVHGNWCFCCQFNFEINGKHKYVFVYISVLLFQILRERIMPFLSITRFPLKWLYIFYNVYTTALTLH